MKCTSAVTFHVTHKAVVSMMRCRLPVEAATRVMWGCMVKICTDVLYHGALQNFISWHNTAQSGALQFSTHGLATPQHSMAWLSKAPQGSLLLIESGSDWLHACMRPKACMLWHRSSCPSPSSHDTCLVGRSNCTVKHH